MGLPKDLQYAEPRTLSVNDCVERFKGQPFSQFIRESSLCTTNKDGVGACHGDSGWKLLERKIYFFCQRFSISLINDSLARFI